MMEENEAEAPPAPSSSSPSKKKQSSKEANPTMANFFMAKPLITSGTRSKAVARYGRIHKRKPPDQVTTKDRGQLQCPPGYRLCRLCKQVQPLDQFYSNVKRYVCKFHHYQMVFRNSSRRVQVCPPEKYAWHAWVDLHYFCPMLGYTHVEYDRHDLKDILVHTKIPLAANPRAVPIDPRLPLRPRNLAIITKANLLLLMKIYLQSCSVAQYILFVQCCNLVPEKADVGYPRDPYRDPDFVRQEIDPIPLLEEEKTRPRERPHVEAVYQQCNAQESPEENDREAPKRRGRPPKPRPPQLDNDGSPKRRGRPPKPRPTEVEEEEGLRRSQRSTQQPLSYAFDSSSSEDESLMPARKRQAQSEEETLPSVEPI